MCTVKNLRQPNAIRQSVITTGGPEESPQKEVEAGPDVMAKRSLRMGQSAAHLSDRVVTGVGEECARYILARSIYTQSMCSTGMP